VYGSQGREPPHNASRALIHRAIRTRKLSILFAGQLCFLWHSFNISPLQLQSWLLEVVEAFMRSHTDMRGTLPEAREVLDMHSQVLNDLTVKVFFLLT
jgi:hypothetical protein